MSDREKEPSFTVRDLISALETMLSSGQIKDDMKVETEGCDCDGDVGSIAIYHGVVCLERTRYHDDDDTSSDD